MLEVLSLTLIAVSCVLSTMEVLHRPEVMLCRCPALPTTPVHLAGAPLFVEFASSAGAAVVITLQEGTVVRGLVWAVLGTYEGWRWWRHSRDGRRRLRERVTGMVVDLGHRLSVVPEPAGAGA